MRFGIREFIFVVLLLSMPVAAYFFVFKKINMDNAQTLKEIKLKEAELDRLQVVTKNIDDLGKEIDKLREAIDLFEQKLPAQREVEVILKQVWELAARHNLTPKKIRTDKPLAAAHYAELPIQMTIVGDFDGFYSFLLDIEKLRRITRMPNLALEKATKADEGQMQADIILSIFFESKGQTLRRRKS